MGDGREHLPFKMVQVQATMSDHWNPAAKQRMQQGIQSLGLEESDYDAG